MRAIARGLFNASGLVIVLLAAGVSSALAQGHENEKGTAVPIDPPSGLAAMAPNLTAVGDGVLLTWLERTPAEPNPAAASPDHPAPATHRLRFCHFEQDHWTQPQTIAERSDFFLNWADVPSITQAQDGSLVAHWLQQSTADPHSEAYDAILARSADGGKTWHTLGPAHHDGKKVEHGFVSLVPQADATVRAFWLDGREMPEGGGEDGGGNEGHSGNMTLRSTAITNGAIGSNELLDMRVCECCNTSAAITSNGPVIVYRDRSEQDTRDISVVRLVNGKWTDPKPVHEDGWQISGCPVNGPATAARGDRVVVAWYTAAQQQPRVLAAFSSDAGATFGPAILIDGNEPLGRVDVALDDDGSAIVCWLATDADKAAIRLARVRPGQQQPDPPITIAQTSGKRSAGFPTMARIGDRVLVVWTQDEKPSRLRARLVRP